MSQDASTGAHWSIMEGYREGVRGWGVDSYDRPRENMQMNEHRYELKACVCLYGRFDSGHINVT